MLGLARLTIPILLLAGSAWALDLNGTWIGIVPAKGRRLPLDIAFQLTEQGGAISGKLYTDGSGSPILTGTLNDGKVSFEIETREQAGNQINIVLYRFEGQVAGDEIELTRERARIRDEVSGVETPVRRPDHTDEEDRERRFDSFTLERLF